MTEKRNVKGELCPWCGEDELYRRYHDEDWGRVVTDDRRLFEFLVLEGAQAGLSWITILRKREGYLRAFHEFDFRKVAMMTEKEEERLRSDAGIVRNRLKIHSAVLNARAFARVVEEFGSFYSYVLSFLPQGHGIINDIPSMEAVPVTSPVSDALSRDLKKRGFKFVGSTIIYSFLQAAGFIDDHLNSCPYKGSQDADVYL